MYELLWIAAVAVVLGPGFYGMGKLNDFLNKNRADRQDLSRMRHKG